MKKIVNNSNAPLLGIGLFFLFIVFILYPTNILIFDEWQYFQQGLAYANGHPLLDKFHPILGINQPESPGQYPIGTPFFLAGLIFLFGKKAVFLQGIISLVGAYFFTIKILKNCQLDQWFALLVFIFFPASFLSRTLMSDLPSLLVISWFLYLMTLNSKSILHFFSAGILAGTAILFREPNLLLVFPFLVSPFFKGALKNGIYGIVGFSVAIGIRLLGSYWAFGDPFFMKDPGVSFSLSFFFNNLIFYLPFLLIVIPLGGWAVYRYKHKFQIEIQVALLLFVGLYLLYGYNGIHFSGVKSVVLGPRFLIPSLPLFAICVAKLCEENFLFIKKILFPLSILSILMTQLAGHYYNVAQQEAFLGMENKSQKIHLIAEVNTIPKIFNPSSDGFNFIYLKDSLLMDEIISRDTFIYVATAFRKDTRGAFDLTARFNSKLDQLLVNYKKEEIFEYTLPDKIVIKQYKVSKIAQ